jgi:PhnB protein
MATVCTYLNFDRETEEAFEFYRSVFKTEYVAPIVRLGSAPRGEGQPPLSEADRNLVMNVALPITGGHILMGTDAPESMGFGVVKGTNIYIMIQPDSRAEADRLFAALSAGGAVEMEMQEMFWGDYYGSFTDRFGVRWMINTASKE